MSDEEIKALQAELKTTDLECRLWRTATTYFAVKHRESLRDIRDTICSQLEKDMRAGVCPELDIYLMDALSAFKAEVHSLLPKNES